jgi:hypothetical protein
LTTSLREAELSTTSLREAELSMMSGATSRVMSHATCRGTRKRGVGEVFDDESARGAVVDDEPERDGVVDDERCDEPRDEPRDVPRHLDAWRR